MTKVRTIPQSHEAQKRADEFQEKVKEGAEANQIHSKEVEREAREAQDVTPDTPDNGRMDMLSTSCR